MNIGERPPVTEDSLLQEPTGFIPAVIAEMRQEFDVRLEDGVYNAVCEVGFKVDKEELMKLLRGDRQSYEKGYEDGRRDAVKHAHWEDCDLTDGKDMVASGYKRCSNCHGLGFIRENWYGDLTDQCLTDYCPDCGAKMDEVSE